MNPFHNPLPQSEGLTNLLPQIPSAESNAGRAELCGKPGELFLTRDPSHAAQRVD